jgi:hypothetical protein
MSPLNVGKIAVIAVAAALLAACGGGGSSVAVVDYQLETALINFVTKPSSKTFTISGVETSGASMPIIITGNGLRSYGELAPSTFEGVAALVKVISITGMSTVGGVDTHWSSGGNTYFDENYNYLGTDYATVQVRSAIPKIGHVGDSGNIYSVNTFSASEKTTLTGSFNSTYSLESETSNSAILKLTTTSFGISGNIKSTVTENYRISPAGSIDLLTMASVAYSEPAGHTITYLYSF